MNRRDLLRLGTAAGLSTLAPPSLLASGKPKPLRIAHLTDVHILPSETARGGFAQALKRVYAMKARPEIILVGGDCVMEASHTPTDEVKKQWVEWHAVLRDFGEIPVHPVLGNHDYHWAKDPSGDPLAQREEGAKWALEELKMPGRFHSFDRGGWRFLQLDSVWWKDRNYRAELDGPQMEWLKAELARTPKTMPILVNSHISIFSACGFLENSASKEGNWVIPKSWMHADAIAIKDLFKAHGNVRLCLSGHMHQLDDIAMNGTRYLCAGAVSGNWWKGRYYDTDPGFLVATLHQGGRAETEYVLYDGPEKSGRWQADSEARSPENHV